MNGPGFGKNGPTEQRRTGPDHRPGGCQEGGRGEPTEGGGKAPEKRVPGYLGGGKDRPAGLLLSRFPG